MEYRHSKHHVYLLHFHLVWCAKRRKKVLVGAVRQRLQAIIQEVAKEREFDILTLEILPDHLHLFVSSRPSLPVHSLVKAIKRRSSFVLRQEFRHLVKLPSLWTHAYFVSTAEKVPQAVVQQYIDAQPRT